MAQQTREGLSHSQAAVQASVEAIQRSRELIEQSKAVADRLTYELLSS